MSESFTFAGSLLDRVAERRADAAWIAQVLAAEGTRFLPMWRLRPLVRRAEQRALAWARRDLLERVGPRPEPIFLGVIADVAHFAVDVTSLERPEAALGVEDVAEFEEARAAAVWLPASDAAIVAAARSLLEWHATHGFCAACGGATRVERAGWVRRCGPCKREHFPRTDPVVIAAVVRGDRCLLGRQPGWPPGLFSALAGFVEPGETLEAAVRRDVYEEAGISVGAVRYVGGQPWPFPHSLMIGCIAEALSEQIVLNDHELAEARWFSRAELLEALDSRPSGGGIFLPGPIAIAHHLIRAFLDEKLRD